MSEETHRPEAPEAPDHHAALHHGQPSGDEPLTARSPLRLRALLSGLALVAAVAAAVVFALLADEDGVPGSGAAAAICAVIALIALADLAVIARRFRR